MSNKFSVMDGFVLGVGIASANLICMGLVLLAKEIFVLFS